MKMKRRMFLKSSVAGCVGLAVARDAGADETQETAKWRIGCYTRPWDKYEYRVALDAIAEAGYRYVGLMTTKSETHLVVSVKTTPEEAHAIGDECRKRNLKVASVYGGDIPVAESLEAGIKGLRGLIDCCAIIGVENLMMGGVGDQKIFDAYYNAIAECCPYAAEKKMGISVKPHGGLNATGPQCRAIINRVAQKNFGLWYDPGNIFYYSDGNLDPVDDAASVDGIVVGMSVKDYLPPKNVSVTPGAGKVDFPKVMARLAKGGFTSGPLIVECLAPGEPPALLDEARKARLFLETLTASL
ncbi:MAG TPA: sugar phosphate isomerase/epimerase family protein [Candidatus Hydrogenedentes bacterium]|nr:sugar phosphate isomerase/epimerase family protein [Candidatus Hydrogenedentota bacterium]HOV72937.1 sugar phosphate isomerase/epimerase family protein [Candidatus Hydrogenedentota bacterium]